jgi:CelD/BcsL family acetyltransferase involved in cellulose biosynthesis
VRGVLVTAEAELQPHLAAWDELAVAAGRPFAAPGWTLAWWRHAAPDGAELRVALAVEGDDLVGVAPFYLAPGRRVPTYRLLASTVSSRVEPLAGDDAAAPVLAEALASAPVPPAALSLDGIPSASRWPALLRDGWPGGRPATVTLRSAAAPYLTVAGGFDEWTASRTSHFRKRMRAARRRIDAGGGTFRRATADTLPADLEAFADLHAARWAARGGSGVVTAAVRRMLADAAEALGPERLRVWCLDADGAVVAVEILLAAGGETSFWLGGFDEARAAWQPSIQTMLRAIEDAFESGDMLVDLGEGDQEYKLRLSSGVDELRWVTLVPPGRRKAAALTLASARRARHAVASRVPSGARLGARRVLFTV